VENIIRTQFIQLSFAYIFSELAGGLLAFWMMPLSFRSSFHSSNKFTAHFALFLVFVDFVDWTKLFRFASWRVFEKKIWNAFLCQRPVFNLLGGLYSRRVIILKIRYVTKWSLRMFLQITGKHVIQNFDENSPYLECHPI
jgi:hypothetical protein